MFLSNIYCSSESCEKLARQRGKRSKDERKQGHGSSFIVLNHVPHQQFQAFLHCPQSCTPSTIPRAPSLSSIMYPINNSKRSRLYQITSQCHNLKCSMPLLQHNHLPRIGLRVVCRQLQYGLDGFVLSSTI